MNPVHIFQFVQFIQQFLLTSLLINQLNGRVIDRRLHLEYFQRSKEALKLEDLAITVKTTKKYHYTRLIDILDTWYGDAPANTFFVTDETDPELNRRLDGHLIGTSCSQGHNHHALNCKLQKELELLAQLNATWSCRFDDDNYVNIPQLLKTLAKFDSSKPFYIGRPTIDEPIQINETKFWFGTGGAGICLSKPLLQQVRPYIPKFDRLTPGFEAPDDVTLGYLITGLLQIPLTVELSFHSHLHKLDAKHLAELQKQSTLGPIDSLLWTLNPMGSNDAQLFYALQCHNYPYQCSHVGKRLLKR